MATVGLVELPAFKLLDSAGSNWTALRKGDPLGGKQILAGSLEAGGHDVRLFNLKAGHDDIETGSIDWNGITLKKVSHGSHWTEIDPKSRDVWGITVNYLQERDSARTIVRYLADGGGRVIVGGSDALAEPHHYLEAGASVVATDKSGAGNLGIVDWLAGCGDGSAVKGAVFADGTRLPNSIPPASPEAWTIPSLELVRAALGDAYWESPLDESLLPIGAIMADLGCDRKCDFCQTPTYRVGYQRMTPSRVRLWLEAQKAVGAKSIIVLSDQFLGRVLWDEGRREVLEIMSIFRELELPVLWGNGLEIGKATVGRGMKNGDLTPDLELIQAVWGWDGRVGCAQAYIPAERPLAGTQAYAKLMAWQNHVAMMEAIVRAGVPDLTYGVIVGLPDDTADDMRALIGAVSELRQSLKSINPGLKFRIVPYAIRPLPGTPQSNTLAELGLLRYDDPAIAGGFWTACADTSHMSYSEVSDWQRRIMSELSDSEAGFQGITAISQ